MLKVTRLVLTALLLCNISLADAALLDWDLIGITFNDGATASGSFTFDTDLNVVTEFDITTTAGTLISSAFNYMVATAHISLQANELGNAFLQLDSNSDAIPGGTRELLLAFNSPLGSSDPIAILYQGGFGTTSYESLLIGQQGPGARLVVGPQVVDPPRPVPEPTRFAMFGMGLVVLGALFLRRSRCAA